MFTDNLFCNTKTSFFNPIVRININVTFRGCFPVAVSSMPVAYDGNQVLECQVTFAYDRYYIVNNQGTPAPAVPQKGLSQITNANNVSETTVDKAPN